jgi:CheY-like chemotaxis protein
MRSTHVLISEHVPEQVPLYEEAFRRINIASYKFVTTGDDVIDYLQAKNDFADRKQFPFPNWLLLDVRTPRRDGYEVLAWLYEHPECRVIPTVLFSTSDDDQHVRRAYQLGTNAYFVKPNGLRELMDTLKLIDHFWRIALSPQVNPKERCE